MTDTASSGTAEGTAGNAAAQQLQGTIVLDSSWGSLSMQNIGPGTAIVEWTQGNPPLPSAQLDWAMRPRIPMPRPTPPTPLKPGPNSVAISNYWYSAGISWTYSGTAGASEFSMNLPGLPTGPDGWAMAAQVESPQQGTFQILATAEPASWVVMFNIMAYGTNAVPTVMIYVDGAFLATVVDGMEVVANGKVVSLAIDSRGLPPTSQTSVGFIMNPGQSASVTQLRARSSPPPSA